MAGGQGLEERVGTGSAEGTTWAGGSSCCQAADEARVRVHVRVVPTRFKGHARPPPAWLQVRDEAGLSEDLREQLLAHKRSGLRQLLSGSPAPPAFGALVFT